MMEDCTVDIERFDKKKHLESTITRKNSAVSIKKIHGGWQIVLTTAGKNEFFVSNNISVVADLIADGKVTLKLPDNRSMIVLKIRDTVEESLLVFLKVLQEGSPIIAKKIAVQAIKHPYQDNNDDEVDKENDKENIPRQLRNILSELSSPSPSSKGLKSNKSPNKPGTPNKSTSCKSPSAKSPSSKAPTRGINFNAAGKLSSPIKRRIALGTGTPSKQNGGPSSLLSPQNLRKQLKPSSPHIAVRKISVPGHSNINKVEMKADILTEEQENIVSACLVGDNVFFTGGAGTGKSTLLLSIVEKLIAKHGKHTVFVTATTGLAACAVDGTTIHQFAGIVGSGENNGKKDLEDIAKKALQKKSVVQQVRMANVLIVDEISMMGPDLLETLNAIVQSCRGNQRPMGGLQIVITGDFFQLPPVEKSKKNMSNYFGNFDPRSGSSSSGYMSYQLETNNSPVWGELALRTFVLTNVFRQSEIAFSSLLNAIRCGKLTDDIKALLLQCVGRQFDCSDGILPTRIFTHRKDVEDLNAIELKKLPGESTDFKATDTGNSKMLDGNCPAKDVLKLKIGAQVILVKTIDPQKGLVNGARGVLLKFMRDTRRPVVRFSNGIERTIMNEKFVINSGGKIMAERTQLPLGLAWGVSVHKSQGMTVEKAVVTLKNVFEYGQAYVALSRVRKLEGLSLDKPLSENQVKVHPDVVAFYEKIEKSVI